MSPAATTTPHPSSTTRRGCAPSWRACPTPARCPTTSSHGSAPPWRPRSSAATASSSLAPRRRPRRRCSPRRRRRRPGCRGQVVPLRRRVGLRHLAVAAAVVGRAGPGWRSSSSPLPGDVMASVRHHRRVRRQRRRRRGLGRGGQGRRPWWRPTAGSGEVVVVMSGVDHTSDRLDGHRPRARRRHPRPDRRPDRRVARARADRDPDRGPCLCRRARHPGRRRHPRRRLRGRRRPRGGPRGALRRRAARPRPSTAPAPPATPASSVARCRSTDAGPLPRTGPDRRGVAVGGNTPAVGSVHQKAPHLAVAARHHHKGMCPVTSDVRNVIIIGSGPAG